MELSRKVLGCLDIFRKQLFDDDDAIKSFLYEVVEHIDQNDNYFEYDIKSEEKMCRYGVCILLIQAGKYGLYREEFEDYVKQLGWDEEKQNAIGEIYEENRDKIRSLFLNSTIFIPHLIDIQCELMDPNEINASNTSAFDFTNIISYYTVTFIYKDLDGEVRSLSKCLNSIQLHKLIDTVGDAIHQCDQFIEINKKEE